MEPDNVESIINVFLKYYNNEHECNKNMFQDIDEYEDTNEILEEFYDHVTECNEVPESCKKLYSPEEINLEQFEQIYGLFINGECICLCEILFPILQYLSEECDWATIDWKIKLKTLSN